MVMDDRKVKVLAWYDNEWGYSTRVVELAELSAIRRRRECEECGFQVHHF